MQGQLVAFLQGDDAVEFDEQCDAAWKFNRPLDEAIADYVTELGEPEEIELAGNDYIAYHSHNFVVVNSGINGLYRAIYAI